MGDYQKEIQKVFKNIPGWFKKTDQLNSKILRGFLALSNSNQTNIDPDALKEYCVEHYDNMSEEQFRDNFNDMKGSYPHGHGKVFEKNLDGSISLWEPVADFIITEYKKIHQ